MQMQLNEAPEKKKVICIFWCVRAKSSNWLDAVLVLLDVPSAPGKGMSTSKAMPGTPKVLALDWPQPGSNHGAF